MTYMMYCVICVQVLTDTRAVQKEINMLTGKLDRQFTVTDELIFKVCIFIILGMDSSLRAHGIHSFPSNITK